MNYKALILAVLLLGGCGQPADNTWKGYDKNNTEVPKGDPSFPVLGTSWVIDKVSVLDKSTITKCDAICEKMKVDGVAEVIVLVQNGVKKPEEYATHYGRWLGLGKAASTAEGGQNGLVWLIRPDADERITVSVGRGLTQFTTVDYGKVMDAARDYVNFNNFDMAVDTIVTMSDKSIREIYKKEKK